MWVPVLSAAGWNEINWYFIDVRCDHLDWATYFNNVKDPPLVFTVIRSAFDSLHHTSVSIWWTVVRHFYTDAQERFPALVKVPHMQPGKALLVSGLICRRLIQWVINTQRVILIIQMLHGKCCTGEWVSRSDFGQALDLSVVHFSCSSHKDRIWPKNYLI